MSGTAFKFLLFTGAIITLFYFFIYETSIYARKYVVWQKPVISFQDHYIVRQRLDEGLNMSLPTGTGNDIPKVENLNHIILADQTGLTTFDGSTRKGLNKTMLLHEDDQVGEQVGEDRNILISLKMKERIDKLRKGCESNLTQLYKIDNRQTRSKIYYSSPYKLTYCKVPKAGSTYWTRIFLELKNGLDKAEDFSQQNRQFFHMDGRLSSFSLSQKDVHSIYEKSLSFLVSRDPYTRLLSAYFDKYVLLGKNKLAEQLAKETENGFYQEGGLTCGYNVSFQDFLDMVVETALRGKFINRHWAPVYILCRPCDFPYKYVIKQETLSEDTIHIMKFLNLSEENFNHLRNRVFHEENKEESIRMLIKTFYKFWSQIIPICPSLPLFLEKIWITFQSQGKISKFVDFPAEKINRNGNNITDEEFSDMIINTNEAYPMSSAERLAQRRMHLLRYYKDIKPETVEKLKHIYSMDFLLFDYDENPPSM